VTVTLTDKEAAALIFEGFGLESVKTTARGHLERAAERYLADPAAYDEAIDQAKREMYSRP
jgi:hypothetical protein